MADSPSHATLADLPQPAPLLAGRARMAWLAALVILCAVVPLLNLVVPAGSVSEKFAPAACSAFCCSQLPALAVSPDRDSGGLAQPAASMTDATRRIEKVWRRIGTS